MARINNLDELHAQNTADRDGMMRAILGGQAHVAKKVDDAAAAARTDRDAMMRGIIGGQAKLAKKMDDQHAETRTHISNEHKTTRDRISDEHKKTRETLRKEIRDMNPGTKIWVGIVTIVIGLIAALTAGYLTYPSLVQFFCWTVDTAGNTVQVADYALKLIGAKTAMVCCAAAAGMVFAWLTAEICTMIAYRERP